MLVTLTSIDLSNQLEEFGYQDKKDTLSILNLNWAYKIITLITFNFFKEQNGKTWMLRSKFFAVYPMCDKGMWSRLT